MEFNVIRECFLYKNFMSEPKRIVKIDGVNFMKYNSF